MTAVAAVILMGGRAERLGGLDKASLDVGGESLLTRVLRATTACSPILLATGPEPRTIPGRQTIVDLPGDYAGPLAGVAAAVAALTDSGATWLLSLAVDTPFFPADFLDRALALSTNADVVMAAFAGQDYPTNALWRLAALATLPAALRDGSAPHSLKRLAAALRVHRLDYANLQNSDPFINANTPTDLANLRRRAMQNDAQ